MQKKVFFLAIPFFIALQASDNSELSSFLAGKDPYNITPQDGIAKRCVRHAHRCSSNPYDFCLAGCGQKKVAKESLLAYTLKVNESQISEAKLIKEFGQAKGESMWQEFKNEQKRQITSYLATRMNHPFSEDTCEAICFEGAVGASEFAPVICCAAAFKSSSLLCCALSLLLPATACYCAACARQ